MGRDLAQWVSQLGRLPSGGELEEWLEEHRLVSEVYVGAEALDQALHRHLGPAFARPELVQRARHPGLEALIARSPGSVEHCLVYSDWLQERSDPLGELIALGVAAAGGAASEVGRFERHLKSHEAYFLGSVARYVPDAVSLGWRFGLVHAIAATAKLDPRAWEQLLQLRVCQFLHEITISFELA